jgi:hypothetical protein
MSASWFWVLRWFHGDGIKEPECVQRNFDGRINVRSVRKEVRSGAAKESSMNAHERLVTRVADEQDDILGTIQLIDGDEQLQDRLYEQLVDLLVEGMFLDLREDYLDGTIARDAYVEQLAHLAERCRSMGLLPLPSRHP